MEPLQGLRGVLVLEHQHDAFDRVRIVVLAEDALALLVAEHHVSQIADRTGTPFDLGDDDRADAGQVVQQADAAHHEALLAAGHAAATGIGVVVVDGVDDIGDAEAVVLQLLRIRGSAGIRW